jgi:hypothetical protein
LRSVPNPTAMPKNTIAGSTMAPLDGIVNREAELVELDERFRGSESFVVHGPSGVGKTVLLRQVTLRFPNVLYCADSSTGHSAFRDLAGALLSKRDPVLRRACGRMGAAALNRKSTLALRGLVMDALHGGDYWVVLDHLSRTSAGLASDIREIIFRGNTPIVAVARSIHMEELGFLTSFFALRSERLEVRPFSPEVSRSFANLVARTSGFTAANRDDCLERIVELSGGLPGMIVALIGMAGLPRYRSNGHVKLTSVYIDYRLAWHAANAF